MNKMFITIAIFLSLNANCQAAEQEMYRFYKTLTQEQLFEAIRYNQQMAQTGLQLHEEENSKKHGRGCNCHLTGVIENYVCLAEIYLVLAETQRNHYKQTAKKFLGLASLNASNIRVYECIKDRINFLINKIR